MGDDIAIAKDLLGQFVDLFETGKQQPEPLAALIAATKDFLQPRYYYLKKGEIIQEGDECEVSAKWNDPPKWVPAGNTVGQAAPDPAYMAHRIYRRLIKP